MMFKDRSDDEYRKLAALHVEALNHALEGIPAGQVRLHVCWGNYEGPHHHDAPMAMVLPIALRARVGALLFESANPRHAHEWRVFAEAKLPEQLLLVPGVIDSTTNFIEHPQLIAERIWPVRRHRGPRAGGVAGTDCGFSTFAGFGAVDEDIVYAKLASLGRRSSAGEHPTLGIGAAGSWCLSTYQMLRCAERGKKGRERGCFLHNSGSMLP